MSESQHTPEEEKADVPVPQHTPKEEDALMRNMLRGIISIAAGEPQAAAMFDNPQTPSAACQTINRMIDYTKKFIRENA